ncbi:MAG: hypothetical protein QM817_29090 [Archangium sp.]
MSNETPSGFKYGLLLVASVDGPTRARELSPGVWARQGALGSLIAGEDVSHWREWVGSIEWDALTKEQLLIDTRRVSERPEVMDQDNLLVETALERVRTALLLAGPVGFMHGPTRILSGEATGPLPSDRLRSIRRLPRRGDEVVRPFCMSREDYWDRRPQDCDANWEERLSDNLRLLTRAETGGVPRLLFFGLLAFQRAFEALEIEFKIPECVRAAESILGLPRNGGGQREFADRVLRIAPELRTDWYVGGDDIHTRLVNLYVHRNDCVHGKIPFAALAADTGPDEAARFDYLAEATARAALRKALSRNDLDIFRDRARLEAAWAGGSFPP